MRIPKFWTKGSYTGPNGKGGESTFSAWGWSLDSLAAARDDAAARAKRVFDCVINGKRLDRYEYVDRPMREEIVDVLHQGQKEVAIVTRNGYGALVLNAASVMFVDVDFPRIKANGLWDGILLALSRARRQQRAAATREATLEAIRRWSQANPDRSFRVYRTFAGLRLLFVDGLYEPTSEVVDHLLAELGSDPLYRRLTSKQACFRARLTPKPWRCHCISPPNRYPWKDAEAQERYRAWERQYAEASKAYAVCELVETCGSTTPGGEVAQILELHDRHACDGAKAKLA